MFSRLKGQSLLELLLSLAVGTIMIGWAVVLMGTSLKNYQSIRQHLQANTLLRQSAEVIISLAKDNWHSIADLVPGVHYKLSPRNNIYTLQKGEEKIFNNSGLVAYWNFDEATSTIAYDSSGGTNNGTLVNGPTWQSSADCVSGSCLSFDGSDDYVDCGTGPALMGTTPLTIESFIKTNSATTQVIIQQRNGGYNGEYMLLVKSDGRIRWLIYGDSDYEFDLSSVRSVNDGDWHQVVVTREIDGGGKIYIDGTLDSSIEASLKNLISLNVFIGADKRNDAYYFNGAIDEMRIYNRALSAEEIKVHYKAYLDKLGLVSYWAFDENGGSIAYDSQLTNNGTLVNGPTWQSSADCVSGSCLSFDGSDDYVDCGDNESLNITDEITIEAWVKFNDISDDWIIDKSSDDYNNGYLLRTDYPSNKIFLVIGDGTYHIYSYQAPISPGIWYYVVGVYDGNFVRIYLNGEEKGTPTSFSGHISYTGTGNLFIGSRNGDSVWFNGLIDEVKIYNRALTAEEIAQHYQAGYTRYIVVNKVSRNSGNIEATYNEVNNDPATIKVHSVVKYGRGLISSQKGGVQQISFYLTRSENNKVFQQTDWSGGSGQTGPVPNPGNKYDSAENIIFLDFSNWTLGGGAYVEDGILYLPDYDAYALSPYIDINYADKWYFSADYYTEENSDPGGSCSYDACRLLNSYYYDADYNSTTNSEGYSANGSARQILLNQWYRNEWSNGNGGTGGPNVKYVRIKIRTNTDWTPASYKVKNPLMTINGDWTYDDIAGKIFLANSASQGILTSSILDTGISGGAGFNSLLWQGSLGDGGSVKFQIAFSNSSDGPWTYYGPTSTSDYYQPNPGVSISFPTTGSASPQNYRYIRYKVYLSTTGTTPQINDIIINWSP